MRDERSVISKIDEHHKKFTSDAEYPKGLQKLDRARLEAATSGLKEQIATFINYHAFVRNMRATKIARGSLSKQAEQAILSRGEEAVHVYRDISDRISQIGGALADAGLDKTIDRHSESLCESLEYN